ncbi:MAG: aminopeptidase, partial [Gammaproteobacteria bacterium]
VYVKNDSSFNESFANTVEQVGLQRWYQQLGTPEKYQAYLHRRQQHNAVIRMLAQTRNALRRIYAEPVSDTEKEKLKTRAFASLKQTYHAWRKHHSYAVYDDWMKQKLNNAQLALIATYSDKIPAFKAMLASVHGKLPSFYALARKVGKLPPAQRNATLQKYLLDTQP